LSFHISGTVELSLIKQQSDGARNIRLGTHFLFGLFLGWRVWSTEARQIFILISSCRSPCITVIHIKLNIYLCNQKNTNQQFRFPSNPLLQGLMSLCNINSFIHQWLYSPLLGSGLFDSFIFIFTQTVGVLGRVISPL
jgi:hypothetical protein